MKKCCLCDGRVVNGICTQCGMHNGRSDASYHMNERAEEYSHRDEKNQQNKEQQPKKEKSVHRR